MIFSKIAKPSAACCAVKSVAIDIFEIASVKDKILSLPLIPSCPAVVAIC